jgi:hypothetical protein
MPPRTKKLLLINLTKGTVFKVTETQQVGNVTLTLDGIYRVSVARADHGKTIRIVDLATIRRLALGSYSSGPRMTVPIEQAKLIEVYEPGF